MDFSKLITDAPSYFTKESLTILGAMAALYIGWKVGGRCISATCFVAKKFTLLGATAAILVMGGLGTAGFGTGEIVNRISSSEPNKPKVERLTESTIKDLADKCKDKPENLASILAYAKDRDMQNNDPHFETLTKLALAANKDNKEAVVALIEYAKTKGNKSLPLNVAASTLLVGDIDNIADAEKSLADAKPKSNPDTHLTIPQSIGAAFLGIGMCVCGVYAYRFRLKQPAVATA
jgi:hypothetical protein